jgi:outer membrane lipoprotein-sorting protein
MIKKKLLILFLAFFYQYTILAVSDNSLLLKLRKNLVKASPFCLNFKQQVYDDKDMITEESGNIYFINVKKLKWVYNNPDYKIFIIQKNKYLFYEKDNNQLTKGIIKSNRQKWIWQILFADSISDKIKCDNKKNIIYIKNSVDDIDLTVYVGKNGLPEKVVQLQGAGVKYVYIFTGYKTKQKLLKDVFNLKLPKDVDIVDME